MQASHMFSYFYTIPKILNYVVTNHIDVKQWVLKFVLIRYQYHKNVEERYGKT